MDKEIMKKVEVLLEYLFINTEIQKADAILGLGSIDYKVAEKCAELYNNEYGKYIIFTGDCGKGTKGILTETEAKYFRDIAVKNGVSEEKIYLEEKATNTLENFIYSRRLMKENKLKTKSIIVLQKPYEVRRSTAVAEKLYGDKKVYITSPDFSIDHFVEYFNDIEQSSLSDIISEIVAEINILEKYPRYDMLISQRIPKEVKKAYEYLVNKGYTKYIFSDEQIKVKALKFNKLLEEEN